MATRVRHTLHGKAGSAHCRSSADALSVQFERACEQSYPFMRASDGLPQRMAKFSVPKWMANADSLDMAGKKGTP